MNTILKEEKEVEKKPVYESPKVSKLDEKEALAEISRMVTNNFDIPPENPAV